MTSNRRIILHIGSPKCGSTYLQQVMIKNQKRLLQEGIHYPHAGGGHPGNASDIINLTAASLDALFPQHCHTLILSHEDLVPQPPRGKPLAELAQAQGIYVQVVNFLRPFNEFIYGDYSQFMKQHFSTYLKNRQAYDGRSFEEFASARAKNISMASWLNAWGNLFSDTEMRLESHRRIRPVMQELADLPADMQWDVHADQINRSLRVADCEALATALRDTQISDIRLRVMFHEAYHKVEERDAGRTPRRDHWIEELFAEQNQKIHAQFGLDNRLDPSQPYP